MICDICNERDAVLFIEQANGTIKRKLNLCVECAQRYGITPESKTIGKSLAALFSTLAGEISKKISEDDKKLCPVCGTSLAFIKQTNKTGCPECYSIFKEEVKTAFKNIGVKSSYTGTMPKRLRNFKSVLTDRIVIQSKLEESLRQEDYEKAAIYRDYLRALEKSPVAEGAEDDGQ